MVEVICVGTEILMGNIVNTNAAYIGRRCTEIGVGCHYQTVVGDNPKRVEEVVHIAKKRANIILLTGGLGPTQDDLTKQTVAQAFGRKLVMNEAVREDLISFFAKRNVECTENNFRQALIPESATILDNPNGTAPGIYMVEDKHHVFMLPGPPGEMKPMLEASVLPILQEISGAVIYSEMIKLHGIGESAAETRILDLLEAQSNPTIAPYAKLGEVHFRISAKAKTKEEAEYLVAPVSKVLEERFGSKVYSKEEESSLASVVVDLCKERNYRIATAESCTAGMLISSITEIPGVSDIVGEAFITYSNEAKQKELKVSKESLEAYGAVSKEVAREMVEGLYEKTKAEVCLAITGIAGPTGGSIEKPVGLVYMACKVLDRIDVKEYHFSGNRSKIRESSVIYALGLMRAGILEL